jgi:3-oxoacyl-[acyl-carrier protein] reductase
VSPTLTGRRILVTGVSRRVGIAFTVARAFADAGAAVFATGWSGADAEQPWGADETLPDLAGIEYLAADLAEPAAPARVVAAAHDGLGGLDVLAAVHARSSAQSLAELDAAELDRTFAVNARATLLLVKEFVARFDGAEGRVITFSSGQHRGPMPGELPYIASKAAIRELTTSLAAELGPRGITVNCVNPGPVDTGYADAAARARLAREHPRGRWGTPADIAAVLVWLASAESDWVTGQTLDVDGGWSIRTREGG